MVSKRLKRFKKAIGLASLPFICVALLLVPTALGQSNQQGEGNEGDLTIFKADIMVGNKSVSCPFTVTDNNHKPLKGQSDHYVALGDLGLHDTAIDRDLTGEVVIPDQVTDEQGNVYDVTAIGDYAFSYCSIGSTGLKDNKNITQVGVCSYLDCKNLSRTDLETSGVVRANTSAFAYSGISDTGLANNTTLKTATFDTISEYESDAELGANCFGNCSNLKTTGLENNNVLTEVRDSIFQMCENLESTGLENNTTITKIDKQAFCNCPSLTKTGLENNETVTFVGNGAFQLCTGLSDTGLANSAVKTIDDGAFFECSNLTTTSLDKNSSVESIGKKAFKKTAVISTGLSNNTSVKSLGDGAFDGLDSLTDTGLAGNSTLESVGIEVFGMCKNLTDTGLNTNTGLKELGEEMFITCDNLVESGLTQNKTISKIGKQAFAQCHKLGSESSEFCNAGDLALNGSDGKLDVGSFAFAGTKYTKLYVLCDADGLTTSDDMFGTPSSGNSVIRGLPVKSQITTVYVSGNGGWKSVSSKKIGGVTYSTSDDTLIMMNPIKSMTGNRMQTFRNPNVVELRFPSCGSSFKVDLKYGSDGEQIGTFDVDARYHSFNLESKKDYSLRNYKDTLVATLSPDKPVVFPADAQAHSYNCASDNESVSCDLSELNYSVKFDAGRGTGKMADQNINVQKDGGTALNGNEFTYAGHHFVGWNTRSDGRGTQIEDRGMVNDLCNTQLGVVKLYAQWEND